MNGNNIYYLKTLKNVLHDRPVIDQALAQANTLLLLSRGSTLFDNAVHLSTVLWKRIHPSIVIDQTQELLEKIKRLKGSSRSNDNELGSRSRKGHIEPSPILEKITDSLLVA